MRDLLEQYLSRNKRLQYEVKTREAVKVWSQIHDGYIGRHTTAAIVKDRTLYVHTDSSALASELTLREEELVAGLNSALGVRLIERILFTAGTVQHGNHTKGHDTENGRGSVHKLTAGTIDRIESVVQNIEEEELREVMKKFLKSSALRNIRNKRT
jgi:predicted nucleic acid-binding Zn ribbon protein